jgi:hypothetical protein
LRGHEVKVLICNAFLKGCAIKRLRNKDIKNPCSECKINIQNLLPLFGLDYIYYTDYISPSNKKKIYNLEKKISQNLKNKVIYKNFNLTKTVNESLVRYYYGNKFSDNYNRIRLDHINTSLTSIIFAEKVFKKWNPDIILSNMPVYSSREPFFIYFKKKRKKLITISLTPLNEHAVFFNLNDFLLSNSRFKEYLKKRGNKILNFQEKKHWNQEHTIF